MVNEKKPLVSICCITYNHEKYIAQAIDSFLMQETSFEYEILIGEDGSSDNTRVICQKYADSYPDIIRLFKRKREDVIYVNGKPTGRFNLMETLKAARGKYIAICEGDDYWTSSQKLQIQAEFLEVHEGYSFCAHNYVKLFGDEFEKPKAWIDRDVNLMDILTHDLKYVDIRTLTLMITNNSKILDPYFKFCKGMLVGDFPLTCLTSCFGKGRYMNAVMGVYRIHKKGVSVDIVGKKHLWYKTRIPMLKLLKMQNLVSKDFSKQFKIFYSKVHNYYGRLLWKEKQYFSSLFYLKGSIPFVLSKLINRKKVI